MTGVDAGALGPLLAAAEAPIRLGYELPPAAQRVVAAHATAQMRTALAGQPRLDRDAAALLRAADEPTVRAAVVLAPSADVVVGDDPAAAAAALLRGDAGAAVRDHAAAALRSASPTQAKRGVADAVAAAYALWGAGGLSRPPLAGIADDEAAAALVSSAPIRLLPALVWRWHEARTERMAGGPPVAPPLRDAVARRVGDADDRAWQRWRLAGALAVPPPRDTAARRGVRAAARRRSDVAWWRRGGAPVPEAAAEVAARTLLVADGDVVESVAEWAAAQLARGEAGAWVRRLSAAAAASDGLDDDAAADVAVAEGEVPLEVAQELLRRRPWVLARLADRVEAAAWRWLGRDGAPWTQAGDDAAVALVRAAGEHLDVPGVKRVAGALPEGSPALAWLPWQKVVGGAAPAAAAASLGLVTERLDGASLALAGRAAKGFAGSAAELVEVVDSIERGDRADAAA